jgi:hypothetical protein
VQAALAITNSLDALFCYNLAGSSMAVLVSPTHNSQAWIPYLMFIGPSSTCFSCRPICTNIEDPPNSNSISPTAPKLFFSFSRANSFPDIIGINTSIRCAGLVLFLTSQARSISNGTSTSSRGGHVVQGLLFSRNCALSTGIGGNVASGTFRTARATRVGLRQIRTVFFLDWWRCF